MLYAKSETMDAPDEADEITLYLPQQMLYDALGELIPDFAFTSREKALTMLYFRLPADCPVMNEISHRLYVWKD